MQTDLYKSRSLGRCIEDAYDLFSHNLKSLVRRLWLPCLVMAAAVAAVIVMSMQPALATDAPDLGATLVSLGGTGAALLVAVGASVVFAARLAGMLNGMPLRRNLRKTGMLALLYAGLIVVLSLVLVGIAMATMADVNPETGEGLAGIGIFATCVLAILMVLLVTLLPAAYSSMKYLVEPDTTIATILGKPYRHGWRHWGFLFVLGLLTSIIIAIISALTQLPVGVLTVAQQLNAAGMAMGDASGLSPSFSVLMFVVSTLCFAVYCFAEVWAFLVLYYAYGSIESKHLTSEISANDVPFSIHNS